MFTIGCLHDLPLHFWICHSHEVLNVIVAKHGGLDPGVGATLGVVPVWCPRVVINVPARPQCEPVTRISCIAAPRALMLLSPRSLDTLVEALALSEALVCRLDLRGALELENALLDTPLLAHDDLEHAAPCLASPEEHHGRGAGRHILGHVLQQQRSLACAPVALENVAQEQCQPPLNALDVAVPEGNRNA